MTVKQRKDKDTEILERSDVGIEEMEKWTRELFLGAGTEKFRITEDMLELGFKVMGDNYRAAKSDVIRREIRRKVLHTREVVEAGYEIIEAEGREDFDPYMVGAVTFLHDMGRFPQAHLGSYSDSATGFDHASASAEIVLAADLTESEEMGLSIQRVVEAVREHSRLAYEGTDIYAKLARDADKLALMDYFPYHIKEDRFPNGKVTPGALEAFQKGRLVLKADMVNMIDIYLSWLSWEYDFNFEATKELFEAGGVRKYMLQGIKKMDKEVYAKCEGILEDGVEHRILRGRDR